jgi:hypothetical protein
MLQEEAMNMRVQSQSLNGALSNSFSIATRVAIVATVIMLLTSVNAQAQTCPGGAITEATITDAISTTNSWSPEYWIESEAYPALAPCETVVVYFTCDTCTTPVKEVSAFVPCRISHRVRWSLSSTL